MANRLFIRSTKAQYDVLPIKDIARRQASITRAGSIPVAFSSAEMAVCQSWERGPIGSSIRPAMFNWWRSMAVLKFVPFHFKKFSKVSTFFGHKSGWKGTGVSPPIAFMAVFDKPYIHTYMTLFKHGEPSVHSYDN